jgi:hypothetical protein
LAIKIQEHFQFGPGWYREGEVRALVLQYYFVLRSVLRAQPCLRRCLTRCRHCRIFILTHPRNAGRGDLRCPFGCKDAHRKRSSTQRSTEYYDTAEGKIKKKLQNGKRSKGEAKLHSGSRREEAGQDLALDGWRFDARMVSYVGMVTSLIEGRRVSLDEILQMLARAVRQHSMARGRRIDYVLRYLMKNAP